MTSLQAFSSLMESNIGGGDLVLTPLMVISVVTPLTCRRDEENCQSTYTEYFLDTMSEMLQTPKEKLMHVMDIKKTRLNGKYRPFSRA